jgi:hypothetical protein
MSAVLAPTDVTSVTWEPITLSDTHPTTGVKTTFTFSKKMIASPLTDNGGLLRGSRPDGKALWWPWFQERHKAENGGHLWWVQGHLLNDNVHGPGVPTNLLPISNTLNTNMEALVESIVKEFIKQGQAVKFVVEAHWEGAASKKDGNTGPEFHPAAMRETYGIKGIDATGTLLWGEQFAPTRLSWQVFLWNRDPITGQLLSTPQAEPLVRTNKGKVEHYDPSQWSNHFPG